MPELSRREWAAANLDQVRSQLLDAAAFGKHLSPDQLEHAAFKIAEGLRVLRCDADPAGDHRRRPPLDGG